jgi:hypothetical protein
MVDEILQDPEALPTVIPAASDHREVFVGGHDGQLELRVRSWLSLRLDMMVVMVELVED